MSAYELSNAWESARRRLALLEAQFDPISQRRLARLGAMTGWRCLEVGGGGGSVARWLCDQVGASGSVIATDIDTRFLDEIDKPQLAVLKHDILTEELPAAQFDLVHTRWLLHHLAQRDRAIAHMMAALRPGGWLLIEEPDIFPVHASTSQLYVDFMAALTGTVVLPPGGDCRWARTLPELLSRQGLAELSAEGEVVVFNGASPMAEFLRLTAEQVRAKIVHCGALDGGRFGAAMALLGDPAFWAFGPGTIAAWGRQRADMSVPPRSGSR
jgi:SAM-dependent methyltransferase